MVWQSFYLLKLEVDSKIVVIYENLIREYSKIGLSRKYTTINISWHTVEKMESSISMIHIYSYFFVDWNCIKNLGPKVSVPALYYLPIYIPWEYLYITLLV